MSVHYGGGKGKGEQINQALNQGPKRGLKELRVIGKLGGKKQEFRTWNALCTPISYVRGDTLK